MVRRRRPVLRAAAVGGGAYALGKRRAERQEYAEQQAPAGAGDGGGLSPQDMERLRELARLHEQGVLSDRELAEQKARILK